MLKKIILSIVIAAVLSVTAFGAVYAYQKEKIRSDQTVIGENLSLEYGTNPGENCDGYAASDSENCLKQEERSRNNLRYRENEGPEFADCNREEYRWQYRYENEKGCSEKRSEGCEEGNQLKNQKGYNFNGRGSR